MTLAQARMIAMLARSSAADGDFEGAEALIETVLVEALQAIRDGETEDPRALAAAALEAVEADYEIGEEFPTC